MQEECSDNENDECCTQSHHQFNKNSNEDIDSSFNSNRGGK